MRKIIGWLALFLLLPGFAPGEETGMDFSGEPAAASDRTVSLVALRNASPERIREYLLLINRNWGLFPSLQFLEFPVPEGGGELLLLRGRQEEAEEAVRIAEELDRLYPSPAEPEPLAPVPLAHLGGPAMREKLLALARAAGLALEPEQLLVFPPGSSGSLFFRGPAAEAKQVRDLKAELDQPRYGSPSDLWSGFYREFRKDLSANFLAVTTYAASALLLLCLHFLLGRVPWLGKRYQQWFTLIWTHLIHDVRGRDFAYEVIKRLVETAVDSVEQLSRRPLAAAVPPAVPVSPETKKSRAMAIARDLLVFRGFDPDDPEIKRMVSDLVEAAVYRLHRPDRGE